MPEPSDPRVSRAPAPREAPADARHDLSPDKFPLTIRLLSGRTGDCVWSRTVTLDEARELARIEVPGFAGSEHYPVRTEVTYADGSVDAGDQQ